MNLKALFFGSQAIARACLDEGKTPVAIVNIASLLPFQGRVRASCSASKHGVAGLTKVRESEWAAMGINVNTIAPGFIATTTTTAPREDPERNRSILDRIPAGRWGAASDVGGTAAILCAFAARYIHGAMHNIDGGWLAR